MKLGDHSFPILRMITFRQSAVPHCTVLIPTLVRMQLVLTPPESGRRFCSRIFFSRRSSVYSELTIRCTTLRTNSCWAAVLCAFWETKLPSKLTPRARSRTRVPELIRELIRGLDHSASSESPLLVTTRCYQQKIKQTHKVFHTFHVSFPKTYAL